MTLWGKWANTIENAVERVVKGLTLFSLILVVVLMLAIVADVTGRFFFKWSIFGTQDICEFLMGMIVFGVLSYTGLARRHIRVNIFISKFPEPVRNVIDVCTNFIGLAVWIVISWRILSWSFSIAEDNLVSPVLYWPVAPFAAYSAVLGFIFCIVILAETLHSVDQLVSRGKKYALWLIPEFGLVAAICCIAFMGVELPLSMFSIGLIGIGSLLILVFLGMPIGWAMAFVGLVGISYFRGLDAGLSVMGTAPYLSIADFKIVVFPLFLLMGLLAWQAGISKDLYDTASTWIGRLPGGIASATIAACASFAAICGESMPTAAAMGTIAIPEMQRHKYDNSLATGAVAAGGTLGILIPPSIGFIWYAILTEQSVAKLFIAGIIPGIMLASLFILTITIRSALNPKLGPPAPSTTWKQKFASLKGTWAMILLFLLVIGGLYLGVFTPREAAAIGALGALILMAVKAMIKRFPTALMETGKTLGMMMNILIGVMIIGHFFTASEAPLGFAEFVAGLEANRYIIFALILLLYVILGCVMNIIPMIILTLPILWPTIIVLGFDPIWFGVVMVIIMEMGQITPPIGMNVFVIAGVAKDVPMGTIFKGVFPFVLCEIVAIMLLTLFPQIATWLPSMMK